MFQLHRHSILTQQRLVAKAKASGRRKLSTKSKNRQQVRKSSFTAEQSWEQEDATSQLFNIFTRFGAWYSKKLESHPLITKSVTGGLIAASGDVVCQSGTYTPSEHKNEDGREPESFWKEVYSPRRSFHFFIMGGCFAAPLNHIWFNYLSKYYGGKSFTAISKRVFLDQLLWTPAWTVVWMALFWTLEGSKPSDIPKGLKENYPGVIKANWYLWIPAQYLNFYAVPLKFQVLFTNGVELIWNAYLSFVNDGDHIPGDVAAEKDISSDEVDEMSEQDMQRRRSQTLHRRRTFR